jgi:hypothetical protein
MVAKDPELHLPQMHQSSNSSKNNSSSSNSASKGEPSQTTPTCIQEGAVAKVAALLTFSNVRTRQEVKRQSRHSLKEKMVLYQI